MTALSFVLESHSRGEREIIYTEGFSDLCEGVQIALDLGRERNVLQV